MTFAIMSLCVSCKKEALNTDSELVDKHKTFLKEVTSDLNSPYFVSGEFDGYKIYFASTFADVFPDQ